MPTTVKEYSLFAEGSLVQSASDLYMAIGVENATYIPKGTVGLILERDPKRKQQNIRVQFLKGHTYWVRGAEIEPCLK
jgi:hypothetical protein